MIDHVSASAVSTWRDCPRKWGFRYLDGVIVPPGPGAELGSEVHAVLEDYLRTGNRVGTGKAHTIASRGFDLLSLYVGRGKVEQEIEFDIDGVPFSGRIDYFLPEEALIIDHKTTSNKRWAKTAVELATDLQAVLYAHWATLETGSEEIDGRWIYYQTKGAHLVWQVQAPLRSDRMVLDAAASDGRKMLAASSAGKCAEDMPADLSACGKYGGCPYRDRCPASDGKQVFAQIRAAMAAERPSVEPTINAPETEAPPAPEKCDFTLFIDCRPTRSSVLVVELATLLRPLLDKVASDFGVQDYRLVEYGKGPAALASYLRQSLAAKPLRGVGVVVSTRTQECQHTLFVLSELASEIVQGI